ncbi:MAG: membrane protein insertase YidC [Burkholderiales bacterium]|nr:membrane protein insertase YidC [Burkholderiales bacterium]
MTDIRRTLLWVVFTMSLVLLWDKWNAHTGQPTIFGGATRPAAQAPAAGSAAPAAPAAAGVPQPISGAETPGAAAGVPAEGSAAAAAAAERVTVTTDAVRATFDSRGGTLVGLELLAFDDAQAPGRPVRLMAQEGTRMYMAQTGLITTSAGPALPNHLTPMRVRPGPRELAKDAREVSVSFETTGSDGIAVIKTYTLPRGRYDITVTHELSNAGSAPVEAQLYLQLARDGNPPPGESSFYFTFTGPAVYTEAKKFQKIDFKDIAKGDAKHERNADEGWIAMVQHYFASAWLLQAGQAREFRSAKVGDDLYTVAMVTPLGLLEPGATRKHSATLYAGPQQEYVLAELAPGLDLVKDYGWFTILAKPLFWLLTQLYGLIGNWGWAIVALVVVLKIAFYWLNASAYRSMAKMKAVGPRLTELRERYKDKPQQMQQEMMRIYREEKVNPLGGCLPILVQMPFFIALYWVLLSSVEMRNAPWIGWIRDLSAIDPYFILPILMTASSMFQVWLNPRPPDPMQAKLMWFMPLAFGVMFFFFPAGLVLYWLTNNILSIAQQWWINKRLGVSGK